MLKKIVYSLLGILAISIIGLLLFINLHFPNVKESPKISVEITKTRLERGEYLANSVAVCMDCHSTRDWTKFSGPLVEGTLGKGGEEFNQEMGMPGKYFSPNITPFKLKNWSDGDIYRAITCGVNKDGKALFPLMAYPNFAKMTKEDIFSIIAYLRVLKPIKNSVTESVNDFPMNLIVKTIPKDVESHPIIDENNMIEYGKYLFNAASCNDCHTQITDKGEYIKGLELAGGRVFNTPMGKIISANISSDKETGIGKWTKEFFINRFKAFSKENYDNHKILNGEKQTIMPWTMYSNMTEKDLTAIYNYLMTVKPINNKINTHFVAN